MKLIVQKEDPILREKAKEVPLEEITSDTIQSLLKDMHDVLVGKECGVALAASQIGLPLRMFVVANKIFEKIEATNANISNVKTVAKTKSNKEILSASKKKNHLVYINPKIIKTSKKTGDLEEACLSVEGYFGIIARAQRVTVEAYDERGVKFTRGASGLLAQIFQHEMDHLEGILYIDNAYDIQKVETAKET